MNVDWSSFYVAIAGAAATLLGLLFIAVQFNIETLTADPSNRWRAVARSTFTIYVVLFLLPLVFLIPGLSTAFYGYALLIAVVSGAVRAVSAWLPVWRSIFHKQGERVWETLWLLVGPLIAYASLGRLGFDLLNNYPLSQVQENIAITMIWLFTIVLRNSWNLLVEVTYERKQLQSADRDKQR